MLLNEDLFEIDATIAPETSEETPATPEDNGIANQIITEINGEWDTIKSYNDLVLCLKELGRDDFVDVIQDIIKEENVHVGQLQEILKVISPNAEAIADGEQEATEQLPGNEELENLTEAVETKYFPYYVSYYDEYPIYEPAEGGYYYAGTSATHSEGFNSLKAAQKFMDEYVNSAIADGENWKPYGKRGYYIPSKYIGEQSYIILEPNKEYLSRVSGYEPYN